VGGRSLKECSDWRVDLTAVPARLLREDLARTG